MTLKGIPGLLKGGGGGEGEPSTMQSQYTTYGDTKELALQYIKRTSLL